MTTISERLRGTFGDDLVVVSEEAADTIDALVAALEQGRTALAESYDVLFYPANGESKQDSAIVTIEAALSKAKGKRE